MACKQKIGKREAWVGEINKLRIKGILSSKFADMNHYSHLHA